jgi:hypothetical protein
MGPITPPPLTPHLAALRLHCGSGIDAEDDNAEKRDMDQSCHCRSRHTRVSSKRKIEHVSEGVRLA